MFPWYGYLGILFVALGEFLMFYSLEPFSTYLFFILLWLGYILIVDAWVFHRSGTSRLNKSKKSFFGLFILSALFWWFYEVLNFFIENWRYENVGQPEWLMFTIAFSTVLPAVLCTSDLLGTFKLFDRKWKISLSKKRVARLFLVGLIFLILPFVIPLYTFPLVWLSMFFLLDPVNYLNGVPSIIGQLKKGKAKLFLTLMIGALICGFFWEFWNYWAPAKWFYDVPFVGFWKVFEMPLLGYGGYLPFGLSLYAMYQFVLSLFKK